MTATLVVGKSHPKPKPLGCGQLFTKQLQWAFVAEGSHRLTIAPSQILSEFLVQIFQTIKLLPIIEIPLVISVTAFHLAVVPRGAGWDQNMLNTCLVQCNIKRTFLRFTDVFVGELCTIIGLDPLDWKWKCFLKHLKEFHTIFRRVLFKCIYKPYTSTFVNGSPLIQMLAIFLNFTPQTVVRNLFDIDLYFLTRSQQFGIPAIMLARWLLCILSSAQPHSSGCIQKPAITACVAQFLCCHVCSLPAVAEVGLIHSLLNQAFLLRCVLSGMAMWAVGALL